MSQPARKALLPPIPFLKANFPRLFSVLPPLVVLRSITKTYFQHCHNQPYAYFTEKDFSQRLEDEQLPSYLLMVIIATAARFSQDPYFEGRQQEVAERFCHKAWNEICERLFSGDDVLQITIVQATNMLAVVDFTSKLSEDGHYEKKLMQGF